MFLIVKSGNHNWNGITYLDRHLPDFTVPFAVGCTPAAILRSTSASVQSRLGAIGSVSAAVSTLLYDL